MEWFILLDGDLLPEARAKLSVLIADFCFDGIYEVRAVANGTLVDLKDRLYRPASSIGLSVPFSKTGGGRRITN